MYNNDPLAWNATEDSLRSTVALFRQPEQRVLSMYRWIRHTSGLCCTVRDFGWPRGKNWYHISYNVRMGGSPADTVGAYTNCQLNMTWT